MAFFILFSNFLVSSTGEVVSDSSLDLVVSNLKFEQDFKKRVMLATLSQFVDVLLNKAFEPYQNQCCLRANSRILWLYWKGVNSQCKCITCINENLR